MKLKNTLIESMMNRGKILSKNEIIKIIEEYEKQFKKKLNKNNLLKYLSRHNYIKRIFSGIYYINSFDERNRKFFEFEDKEIIFMTLNKLDIKWYIGLNSSLYAHGKKWQTPNQLFIVNEKFSGLKRILGLKVKFLKVKKDLIFGLKRMKTDHNIDYFCSDPAKTYIDLVYFKEINKLIRIKNTKKYLKRFPKWIGKK